LDLGAKMCGVELDIRPSESGSSLRVRVKPRASKSRIVGTREGMLEVAVAAPPVDGEANAELLRLLGRELGVRKSGIRIASGEASREKLVHVELAPESLLRALAKLEPCR
jgi:uncharacterized protein (TIGR00251 family)